MIWTELKSCFPPSQPWKSSLAASSDGGVADCLCSKASRRTELRKVEDITECGFASDFHANQPCVQLPVRAILGRLPNLAMTPPLVFSPGIPSAGELGPAPSERSTEQAGRGFCLCGGR